MLASSGNLVVTSASKRLTAYILLSNLRLITATREYTDEWVYALVPTFVLIASRPKGTDIQWHPQLQTVL